MHAGTAGCVAVLSGGSVLRQSARGQGSLRTRQLQWLAGNRCDGRVPVSRPAVRSLPCVIAPPGMQVGLVDMLYRKSLRVSSAAKGQLGAGKIVNLQSNDACGWRLPGRSRLCTLVACLGTCGLSAGLRAWGGCPPRLCGWRASTGPLLGFAAPWPRGLPEGALDAARPVPLAPCSQAVVHPAVPAHDLERSLPGRALTPPLGLRTLSPTMFDLCDAAWAHGPRPQPFTHIACVPALFPSTHPPPSPSTPPLRSWW